MGNLALLVLMENCLLHLRELQFRKERENGKAAVVIDVGGGKSAAAQTLPDGIAAVTRPPGVADQARQLAGPRKSQRVAEGGIGERTSKAERRGTMVLVVLREIAIHVERTCKPCAVHVSHVAPARGKVMRKVPAQSEANFGARSRREPNGRRQCSRAPREPRFAVTVKQIAADLMQKLLIGFGAFRFCEASISEHLPKKCIGAEIVDQATSCFRRKSVDR